MATAPSEDSIDGKLRDMKKAFQKMIHPSDRKAEKKEVDAVEADPVSPTLPDSMPDLENLLPKPDPEKPSPEEDPENQLPDKTDQLPVGTKDAPAKVEAGDASTELEDKVDQIKLEDPYEYHMMHKARGLLVLFNVVNFKTKTEEAAKKMKRHGSDVDAKKLEATFRRMNFEVIQFDDPKASEMVGILKEVASFDHTMVDCVAVGILTHGTWDVYQRASNQGPVIADTIYATDVSIKLEELTSPFRVKNCHKSLRGKPKLFFIQACRGEKLGERAYYYDPKELSWLPEKSLPKSGETDVDPSTETSEVKTPVPEEGKATDSNTEAGNQVHAEDAKAEDTGDAGPNWTRDRQIISLPESMPIYKDFLVAWSTAPGFYTFRNGDHGSVFVQTLCRYLDEFHNTADILSILTWCNSDIAHQFESYAPSTTWDPTKRDRHEKKQMPWFYSRLTKEIIFKPKGSNQ